MADMSLPSGSGGLLRYNEEYPSNFILKPSHVLGFIVIIILFVLGMKIFFPIA